MESEKEIPENWKFLHKKKLLLLIIFTILFLGITFILYKKIFKKSETYTVVNGSVEKVTNSQGIIIKEENVINLTNNNSVITLIDQGKRVRKTESIALYKDNNYQEYIKDINDMDNQIETLIKDLPEVYSNDISYLDLKIEQLSKEARNETSYIKMQEYKNKIDTLSNKKVQVLGELSPSGSKVRELIDQRKKIEEKYKISSNNIKSPVAGCVTYKIDGLEGTSNPKDILNYSTNDLNELYTKYNCNSSNDFGIKVVNNFLAYVVIKVPNNEYIKEKNSYYMKLTDTNDFSEAAILVKTIQIDEEKKYCIFEVKNSIEKLIDSRMQNFEVVWTKKTGMTVPIKAVNLIENTNFGYVTVIKNGDYIDVPVKIILSNDSIAVVSNLTDEEKQVNSIDNQYELSIFDQIIIKE